MPRLVVTSLALATLALGVPPAAGQAAACAGGDAAAAGTALYGNGTEVAGTATVAGLRTALVLEPYIAPGTRHRLVRAGGRWCSAETALNRAWRAEGRAVGDGRAIAAAYARLAAAPYFDETTVTSHTTAAGVHAITTHARTNGVTAAWIVRTDAEGVRSARWRATGFGVEPFVAQIEGLTALKGLQERYARGADGSLRAARGLPTRADLAITAPAATLTYTTPEGYAIHIVAGDTRQMADSGTDTGAYEVDKLQLRTVRRAIAENYREFYDWGFRAAWSAPRTRAVLLNSPVQAPASEKTGYVYMNDGTSAYCLACVFIADDFQIHMNQEAEEALAALGYSYPAGREYDAYSNVLGHELFHNWQNNYVKPTASGRSAPFSYLEGTARFQETLHAYSDISHQPRSLVYANDVNGCNGALPAPPDSALAGGVFQTPSYAACQFWMPWYTSAGPAGLAELVRAGMPAAVTVPAGTTRNNATKVILGIEAATGRRYVESAAAWARGLITGEGMVYGPPTGTLAPRDWAQFLERWTPTAIAPGGAATRRLVNGGIMGVEVTGPFRPTVTGGAEMAVVRDTAEGSELSYPAAGELVPGPSGGERVYLIASRSSDSARSTTLVAGTP